MKVELNKYYQLNNSKSYFCVTIQRRVKFEGLLVIKPEKAVIDDIMHYGYLVDTNNPSEPDYESELCEIEFKDEDILNEYQLKDMPLFYIDFPYIRKN